MNEKRIGDLIKEARVNSGFKTKKELAEVSGVSPATLTRIEKNVQEPKPETLMQLSRHLTSISYGELMKAAGYLGELNAEHESFITNFMNENDKLDNIVFDLLEKAYKYIHIDSNIHKSILNLLVSPDVTDLYESSGLNELKNAYKNNDFSIENKQHLITEMQNLLNKFSPKLGEFISLNKKNKPIPLVGNICAGDGIIANEEIEEYISYPFLSKPQPDYALRVKGDSMIKAGIQNGDIVFLKKAPWAEFNGQIVAVIINDEEGTLKRMTWSDDSAKFTLIPENDRYQSKEVTPNEVIVCGVYAGHFRAEF